MLRRRRFVSSTLLAAVLASISLFAAPTPGEGTITGAEMVPGSSAAPPPLAASSDASVRFLREGLTGSIVAAIQSVDLTGDGVAEAFVGTSGGLYVLS